MRSPGQKNPVDYPLYIDHHMSCSDKSSCVVNYYIIVNDKSFIEVNKSVSFNDHERYKRCLDIEDVYIVHVAYMY